MTSCATTYMGFFFINVLRGNTYIDFFDNIFIPRVDSVEAIFIILAAW